MFKPTLQPELFDRRQYRVLHPLQVVSHWPHSQRYRLWSGSRQHDRQKYDALVRQHFKCYECGVLLNPRYCHLHHVDGYARLGVEEASDLAAVHPRCHERLEAAMRRESCGCTRVA